jgi:hypothetical protein
MANKKIARSPKRTKRTTTPQPNPAASAPTAPAPSPEPTFTLAEVHALMGDGYRPIHRPADAIDFAEEALGSVVATLVIVAEALADDNTPLADAVYNSRMRAEGAIRVLDKLGRAQRGEVAL